MSRKDLRPYEADGQVEFAGCTKLCDMVVNKESATKFKNNVMFNYGYNMYLDDMPAAVKTHHAKVYGRKIPIGFSIDTDKDIDPEKQNFGIYNHLDIIVRTHNSFLTSKAKPKNETNFAQEIELMEGMKFKVTLPVGKVRVVGFTVEPKSIPRS